MGSAGYLLMLQEVMATIPASPTLPKRPYSPFDKYSDKVNRTYISLRRAASLRQRLRVLMYAYYLGELIAGDETTSTQKSKAKKVISSYYFAASVRTFHIFETDAAQIYRTTNTTLGIIVKLSHSEYVSLCPE
jgi:hypothetical protein